jgi:hypothetical protein
MGKKGRGRQGIDTSGKQERERMGKEDQEESGGRE